MSAIEMMFFYGQLGTKDNLFTLIPPDTLACHSGPAFE